MKETRRPIGRYLAVLAVLVWVWTSASATADETEKSKTVKLNCHNDAGKDQDAIDKALKKLNPGDTLQLTGTCTAAVTIKNEGITLDGGGNGACGGASGATINPSDQSAIAIAVRARDTTIRGLNLTGGDTGIDVAEVALAVVDRNRVYGNAGNGITVTQVSQAGIINSCFENNGQEGIMVNDNSSVRVGFLDTDDPAARPNTIKNNGRDGMRIRRSSNARVFCNVISNNTVIGASVDRSAHAEFSANTINGNGSDGIRVRDNGGVNFGTQAFSGTCDAPKVPTTFADEANNTSQPNGTGSAGGRGLDCRVQGYVEGKLGTLNGAGGATNFAMGCLDNTTP